MLREQKANEINIANSAAKIFINIANTPPLTDKLDVRTESHKTNKHGLDKTNQRAKPPKLNPRSESLFQGSLVPG